MQGPVVDIVLLSLLILFFGRQQHSRPQKYYRLWFVGWVFILLSYAVWEPVLSSPTMVELQNVVRYDLVLAGALLFLMSFLATRERLWTVVLRGLLVGLPALLALDMVEFFAVPRAVLVVVVLAWHAYGVRAAYVLIPKPWRKARGGIYAICIVLGVMEMWSVRLNGGHELFDWALVEVVTCSAVLYMAIAGRRSVTGLVGTAGFLLWGLFYGVGVLLPHTSETVKVVYLCWTLPKYIVAFSMILKTFEDAAAEKAAMVEDYRRLYEDFRMMFEGHPNPMWVYEEESGKILSTNEAAVRRYGYKPEEFLHMRVGDLDVTSEDEVKAMAALYADSGGGVVRHQLKDGRKIWASLSNSRINFQGAEACFLIAREVTDRVEHARATLHQANHDVLTGLPNRALFADRIQQCMKRCDREDRKGTLLTIDVDHFKRINDTYGHQVGDECLKIVAARLSSKIRQVDTIARVGGEEFAAIVGGLHMASDAEKVAESLLRVFAEPLWLGEMELAVTVSIGIAIYPDDGTDVKTLTRRSDAALYAAKRAGRNRAVTAASLGDEPFRVRELDAA